VTNILFMLFRLSNYHIPTTVITDWNDLTAQSFRKDFNYYVPCYFMAFPPHRKQQLPSSSCPMASYSSPLQKSNSAGTCGGNSVFFLPYLKLVFFLSGFFLDSNILQCDSYLGIIIFVLSAVLIALIITGYFYTFYTTISLVATEFQVLIATDKYYAPTTPVAPAVA
jgi:hypothetical protein